MMERGNKNENAGALVRLYNISSANIIKYRSFVKDRKNSLCTSTSHNI